MGTAVSILTGDEVVLPASDNGDPTATDLEEAITSLIEAIPAGMQQEAPPLILAASAGDREMVRRHVQSEDGLNASNIAGWTPVHWAVAVGEEPIIQSLLVLGGHVADASATRLNLDATDVNGFTPLHCATVTCKSIASHLLLAAGASVDCRDRVGQTPLMKAAKWNDVAMCRALLDAGADVTATDSFGQTALHEAATAGGLATHLLIGRGAKAVVAAVDNLGRTALSLALRHSQVDAARELLPEAPFTPSVDETGRTELHWAAANGTLDIVECLLCAGPKRWPCDNEGMTPLMCALETRNVAVADVLLETVERCYGVANRAGTTVLHLAARTAMAAATERLLQRGCDPWRPDYDGRDALMLAVLSEDQQTVATVLRHTGFRQHMDYVGRTALHTAVLTGNAAVVLRLLQAGASAHTVDLEGWTPMDSAVYSDLPAVVDILRCYPTDARRVVCAALRHLAPVEQWNCTP